MSDGYWDGATFLYVADITNGGGGAGTQSYTLTAPGGTEFEVMYVKVSNDEASCARLVTVAITGDGGEAGPRLIGASTAAGTFRVWPAVGTNDDNGFLGFARVVISGGMALTITIVDVTLSEDTAVFVGLRIRSGVPGILEVGASTPVINIDVEKVF